MDTQTLPLVPFGKYKGQPITTLLNDTQTLKYYKDTGILQKYPIVYNICVNQTITTNKDGKTPEHNKLQNLFLDNQNVINLLRKIIYNKIGPIPKNTHYEFSCEFEGMFNWDILIENIYIYKCRSDEPDICDGCYDSDIKSNHNDICIEIKPLLGDDYPCVLRKMKTQIELTKNEYTIKEPKPGEYSWKYVPSNYVLLVKEFNANSTTKEQLIQIFNQSRIKIIFIDELFDDLLSQIITEKVEQTQDIIIHPTQKTELEEENKLLREKLLQAEEKIKQLEEEISSLKSQKQSKNIKDYFGKK